MNAKSRFGVKAAAPPPATKVLSLYLSRDARDFIFSEIVERFLEGPRRSQETLYEDALIAYEQALIIEDGLLDGRLEISSADVPSALAILEVALDKARLDLERRLVDEHEGRRTVDAGREIMRGLERRLR